MTGHSVSSTSIFVSWGQVPFPDQNGVILSYTVTYRALPSGSSQTKNVTAPANHTTLTGLNEYTNYSITVFASTSKGSGNQSTPIVVITDEDSKFVIAKFSHQFHYLFILLISIFVTSLANVMFSFVTCSKVMMLIIFTVIRLLLCHLFDTYAAFQLYNVFLLINH